MSSIKMSGKFIEQIRKTCTESNESVIVGVRKGLFYRVLRVFVSVSVRYCNLGETTDAIMRVLSTKGHH